ncbi:MAG: hypothetical protein QM778_18630 [Myxococcales bacterium]
MLAVALGCGGDAGNFVRDGGLEDASQQEDSGKAEDASTGNPSTTPATEETALGSCEDEILVKDYPVKLTVSGLSAADGTTVWGWVSFGLDYDFCSVLGKTEVKGGSFTLAVTARTAGGYNPKIAFWLDQDGDGKCDLDKDVVYFSMAHGDPKRLDIKLTTKEVDDSFYNTDRKMGCDPFDHFVK